MTIFTSSGRRGRGPSDRRSERELPEEVRQSLPARFEAVWEALVAAADTRPACAVVGRDAARDGAALGEALDGLRTTFELVVGVEPDFASVEALSVAWSEATLEFLHDVSCEDPLTGLASHAHARTRLDELYREGEQTGRSVADTHALVVLELSDTLPGPSAEHQFTRALHFVQVTEMVRAVFSGEETVARLGMDRAVVIARRTSALVASVTMLRSLLADLDLGSTEVRLWIEGLPHAVDSAGRLLGELAR